MGWRDARGRGAGRGDQWTSTRPRVAGAPSSTPARGPARRSPASSTPIAVAVVVSVDEGTRPRCLIAPVGEDWCLKIPPASSVSTARSDEVVVADAPPCPSLGRPRPRDAPASRVEAHEAGPGRGPDPCDPAPRRARPSPARGLPGPSRRPARASWLVAPAARGGI